MTGDEFSPAATGTDPESVSAISRAGQDVFARAAVLTIHMALSGISRTSRAFVLGVDDATTNAPRIEYVENATRHDAQAEQLTGEVERWLERWRDLRFEDGVENDVSRLLWRLLITHSSLLVEALATIIAADKTSPKVAAEALRHLGRFVHPPSHRDRLWLLERGLRSQSPISRDGAALGLAHLNDPAAIPHLQAAIESEPIQSLKEDLQHVLDALQRERDASAR